MIETVGQWCWAVGLLGALIYTLIVAWDFSDLIRDMKK